MRVTEFNVPVFAGIRQIIIAVGASVVSVRDRGDGSSTVAVAWDPAANKRKALVGWAPQNYDFTGTVLGGPVADTGGNARYLAIQLQPINLSDPDTPAGVPFDPNLDAPGWRPLPDPVPQRVPGRWRFWEHPPEVQE